MRRRLTAAVIAAALLLVGGATPAHAKAQVVVDTTRSKEVITTACKADVAIIGARGSGESLSSGAIEGFGTRTTKFAQSVTDQLPSRVKVRYLAVYYPAVSADTAVLSPSIYNNSVASGSRQTVAYVKKLVDNCPKTKIVLMGYSQGAQVMHSAARALTGKYLSAVVSVHLVANPVANHDDTRVLPFTGGTKFSTTANGWRGVLGRGGVMPAHLNNRVVSTCATGDQICHAPSAAAIALRGGLWSAWRFWQASDVHKSSYQKSTFYSFPAKHTVAKLAAAGVK